MNEEIKNELTRTFICIEFPDEVIKEVARVQEVLENWKFHGKMTEMENLHLTFKFLGEISEDKIEKVKEALSKIKFPAFEAKLGPAGIFHFGDNPKIVWIKIFGKEIYELQKKIDESLAEIFPNEERFMGHLTVARLKYVEDKKGFEKYIKNLGVKEICFKIEGFSLKKSELRMGGPVYTTLKEFELIKE